MQYHFNKEKNIFVLQEGFFDAIKNAVSSVTGQVGQKVTNVSAERAFGIFKNNIKNYSDDFKQKSNAIIEAVKADSSRNNMLEKCKEFLQLLISNNPGDKARFFTKLLDKINNNDSEAIAVLDQYYLDSIDGFSAFLFDFTNENKQTAISKAFGIPNTPGTEDASILLSASHEELLKIAQEKIKASKESGLLFFIGPSSERLITNINSYFNSDNLKSIDISKDSSIFATINKFIQDVQQIKSTPLDNDKKINNLGLFLIGKSVLFSYLTNISNEINTKNTTEFPTTKQKCVEILNSDLFTVTEDQTKLYNLLKAEYEKRKPSDLLERKLLIKEYREEINNLLIPAMQHQLNFDRLPTLNFVEDEENAKDMFGRTAHYNPNTSEITVYISGRHPKDIMRSVAHEVVHHAQNCRGEFNSAFNLGEEGYAQSDNHLRNMEKEAYLLGNMLFRDWEDNLKKQRNNTAMINEKSLRAKIRQLISEAMQDASEVKNEPAHEYDKTCECEECIQNKERRLRMSGVTNLSEATRKAVQKDKEVMPLNEWRRLELNSLLMSRFGIVAPHAMLGEKKNKKPDADGDGVPDWADKKPNDSKVGAKETKPKSKKGKVPPQLQAYVKGRGKKDESK